MNNAVYFPGCYKGLDLPEMMSEIRREGFEPLRFSDPPGHRYPLHQHPETKLLAFIRGSMEVVVQGERYHCLPGDKLMIPGDAEHSASVGPEGCEFFWSERIMQTPRPPD